MPSGKKKHCSFLHTIQSLFLREKKQREQNCLINQKITEDKEKMGPLLEVIILGTEGSGKSTLFNQIQLIKGENFCEKFRYLARNQIRKYVKDVIISILTEMRSGSPVLLHSLQNEVMVTLLLQWAELDFIQLYQINLPFMQHLITTLWRDRAIQDTIKKSKTCNRMCNFDYFIEEFVRIFRPHSLPTNDDILRCPLKSVASVRELHITDEKSLFRVVDNDGSLHFRIKNPLYIVVDTDYSLSKNISKCSRYFGFNETGLIFVMDCSSFDFFVNHDPLENKLRESLRLWKTLSKCCRYYPIFVVLNKQDLLKEKILSGIRFEDYFPEIKNFPIDTYETFYENGSDVDRINKFIRFKCMEAYNEYRTNVTDVKFIPICALQENDVRKCSEQYFKMPHTSITYSLL